MDSAGMYTPEAKEESALPISQTKTQDMPTTMLRTDVRHNHVDAIQKKKSTHPHTVSREAQSEEEDVEQLQEEESAMLESAGMMPDLSPAQQETRDGVTSSSKDWLEKMEEEDL